MKFHWTDTEFGAPAGPASVDGVVAASQGMSDTSIGEFEALWVETASAYSKRLDS